MTAKIDSEFVTKALLVLEAQLIYARHHCIQLGCILGQRDLIPSAQATLTLHGVLDLLARTIVDLKSRVVALDGRIFGMTVGSLGELVIRAQTVVITLQLQELRRALRCAGNDTEKLLCTDRFRTLDEVISFMETEVRRANGIWLGHRISPDIFQEVSMPSMQRQLYRHRIREAHHAMRSIGDEPAISHLLRSGVTRPDCPELQSACAHIATMFVISLDVSQDHALFLSRPAIRRLKTQRSSTWS